LVSPAIKKAELLNNRQDALEADVAGRAPDVDLEFARLDDLLPVRIEEREPRGPELEFDPRRSARLEEDPPKPLEFEDGPGDRRQPIVDIELDDLGRPAVRL
jgi:hypothetical protein